MNTKTHNELSGGWPVNVKPVIGALNGQPKTSVGVDLTRRVLENGEGLIVSAEDATFLRRRAIEALHRNPAK